MHQNLKITESSRTLVDIVEEKLISYFKHNKLSPGDAIPKEFELAESLGVGRSVLREALSRFRMLGIIESRTRRGMILKDPELFAGMNRIIDLRFFSEQELLEILGFRITMELGMCEAIVRNVTDEDIIELRAMLKDEVVERDGAIGVESDLRFHAKLYEIDGNNMVSRFSKVLAPVLVFIRDHYKEYFMTYSKELLLKSEAVSHHDIVDVLEQRDVNKLREALKRHFAAYTMIISQKQQEAKA